MIFAAVLAGGIGSRMNNPDLPKQFLDLDGRPILIYTLEKFLNVKRFDCVYVGVHSNWLDFTRDLVKKHFGENRKIRFVVGGKDRSSTIFNIIEDIEKTFGNDEKNVIVTHDSVRPFVSEKMIEQNIDAVLKYGAVNTAVSSVDTIAVSNDGEFIDSIPERKKMFLGQTPQSFNIKLLKKMYNLLSDEQKQTLTDGCMICILGGVQVFIVKGDASNMKVTTTSDYKIAKAIAENEDKE